MATPTCFWVFCAAVVCWKVPIVGISDVISDLIRGEQLLWFRRELVDISQDEGEKEWGLKRLSCTRRIVLFCSYIVCWKMEHCSYLSTMSSWYSPPAPPFCLFLKHIVVFFLLNSLLKAACLLLLLTYGNVSLCSWRLWTVMPSRYIES